MTKFPPVYSDQVSKILITVYENPEVSFDTFTLAQRIHGINVGSPQFPNKFEETVKATEQLIVKGLVDAKQLKHTSLGLYFSEMKFKFKGKQEAIRVRDKAEEFKKELPKILEEPNKVIEEMNKAQRKT
jgi:hypothetical protein